MASMRWSTDAWMCMFCFCYNNNNNNNNNELFLISVDDVAASMVNLFHLDDIPAIDENAGENRTTSRKSS